jgi:uncharacterized protein
MADDFRDLFKWQPGEDTPRSPDSEATGGNGGRNNAEGTGRPWNPEDNPYETTSEQENRAPRPLNEKEVKVQNLWGVQDPNNPDAPPKQIHVLLKDNRGRKAPIFIGPFESLAISMALEGATPERPLTHDLLKILVERLGAKVERVTIDDLWQSVFYARITLLTKDGETVDIDCRPSDAIALALRCRVPIYMAEDVLETAAKDENE